MSLRSAKLLKVQIYGEAVFSRFSQSGRGVHFGESSNLPLERPLGQQKRVIVVPGLHGEVHEGRRVVRLKRGILFPKLKQTWNSHKSDPDSDMR